MDSNPLELFCQSCMGRGTAGFQAGCIDRAGKLMAVGDPPEPCSVCNGLGGIRALTWEPYVFRLDTGAIDIGTVTESDDIKSRLAQAIQQLEEIVCVKEPDRGVVLLSNDGQTHYDPKRKCRVYNHENFLPLGDALIVLHDTLTKRD